MGIEKPAVPVNGREVDLADLLRRMSPRLRGILGAFRVPPEDADDLVQETLMQFVRKRTQIRTPEAWFTGALRKQCLMYWRTRNRRITVAVDQALLDVMAGGAESDAERAALRNGVARKVATLEPKCQELLRLRYGLGLDDDEVAEKTRYKRSSVDKVTRRCVEALSRKIAAADLGRLRLDR